MKERVTLALLLAAAVVAPAAGQKKLGPLTIREQGSFFVGGENKTIGGPNPPATSGDITVNQMYVQ